MRGQQLTLGNIGLWRSKGAHGRGRGCKRSPAWPLKSGVTCEATQHESLPWANRCSHEFKVTCAACRSCPTLQRAPQTRDCGATPQMPSPAWAQRTIRFQIALMGEMAGRGAPPTSLRPALGQTRARMGTLGGASILGRFQVGGQLWRQGGVDLLGTATVMTRSCTHWLVHT